MNFKDYWVLWVAAAAVIVFWVMRGKGLPLALSGSYYVPPAGGTAQPGTAPVSSASLALAQVQTTPTPLPVGAVTGPAVGSRTGRGHF